jgi:AraC-like DNA-binding protein
MKSEMMYIVNHKEESPLHLIGHFYLFLDCLIRSSQSTQLKKTDTLRNFYIKEAISFVEQNFQNDITVEEIANFCGLNRSYFGKIFHENVGKSPQEFLISYRMIKAAELLKLTKLSIADIGQAVGYPNQLHFSRAFKKVYGISPKQWRKENHS